jgi:thymidine phosphorylase
LRNDRREPRLDTVVLGLCAEMLVATGIETDRTAATANCEAAVTSGRAVEIFGKMVAALGGPSDFVDNSERHLVAANVVRPIHADGYLTSVDTRGVGNAIIELGGGRRVVGQALDLSVGFSEFASIGTLLDKDTPLAVVHAADESGATNAEALLRAACKTRSEVPQKARVIAEILTGNA